MPPVRRLPVLQNASTADEDRPAWHWAVIGTLFALSIWVPLAMLALRLTQSALGKALAGPWIAVVLPPVVAYAFSCWAAGALVGRFGTKARLREATVSGAGAGVVGAALTLARVGVIEAAAGVVVLVPLGLGASWLGGRFGLARRAASVTRAPPPPPSR